MNNSIVLILISFLGLLNACKVPEKKEIKPPNVLLAISDDQSFPHASSYGCKYVNTPAFDKIAEQGFLFTRAYAPSPSCSPSRASLLTGRNIWQMEEAGVHCSYFPKTHITLSQILERNGFHTGFTGKGWEPGNWYDAGWEHNPPGKEYNEVRLSETPPTTEIMFNKDYTANFEKFLNERKPGQPFFFWYGAYEPHRQFEYGSGYRAGKKLSDVTVPSFLYDDSLTRMDLLDYAYEIEWFDHQLAKMVQLLEDKGELDNTIIIVTSDNGMPFPRAKVNLYDYGIHVPLAVCWGNKIKHPRKINTITSLIDIMPTILEATGIKLQENISGKSFFSLFSSNKTHPPHREFILAGKERHNYARSDNKCYPIRALRIDSFLYLRNFKPDRWPSGDPPIYKDSELGKVSGQVIMEKKETDPLAQKLFELNVNKRPEEELYNVSKDPGCLHNLAQQPEYEKIKQKLGKLLTAELEAQNDPRIQGKGDVFDSYPAFWPIVMKDRQNRSFFPGFSEQGKYNFKILE